MQNSTKPSAHEQKTAFKVRDERKPGHHWADNEVLDIYAQKIGLDGYAVYMYLARHSDNRSGRCTKSLSEIATAFKTSSDTVYRAIKKLMAHSLVAKYDVVGKASIYVLLEVPKKSTPTAHSGAHPPHTAATPTAHSGAHPPHTAATPTAHSGDHPPRTADTPPLIAVTPPHTAVPNKEVRLFQDFSQDLNPGNSAGELRRRSPSRDCDPRFAAVCDAIRKCWPKEFKCSIGPADAGAINRMLASNPDWKAEELSLCIAARFDPNGSVNRAESIKAWIAAITDYQSGPQDKFKRPLCEGDAFKRWCEYARTILYGPQPEQLELKPAQSPTAALPPDAERASASALWEGKGGVLDCLSNRITEIPTHSFNTWFKPTRGFVQRGKTFYVEVPNREFLWIGEKYGDLIRAEIEGAGVTEVKFLTSDELASTNWEQKTA